MKTFDGATKMLMRRWAKLMGARLTESDTDASPSVLGGTQRCLEHPRFAGPVYEANVRRISCGVSVRW